MKPYFPLAGMLLVAFLALGSGCAEDDGLLGIGGGTKRATPSGNSSPDSNPSPTPSGSGLHGGFK